MERTKQAAPLPLHPFLFAAFTVTSLYARNRAEVPVEAVLRPSLIVVGATLSLVLLLWALSRRLLHSALAATALLLVVFSYGPVASVFYGVSPWGFVVAGLAVIAPIFFLPGNRTELTRAANIGSFCTLIAAVVPILAPPPPAAPIRGGDATLAEVDAALEKAESPAKAPDIYYIVVDRYASGAVLNRYYGFDNRPFLDGLRARGFFVAERSKANYPKTSYALAASLNLAYPHREAQRHATHSGDWKPVNALLAEHRVGKTLQRLGYRYIHLGAWWDVTATSPIADLNVNPNLILDFDTLLFRNTLLAALKQAQTQEYDMRREHWSAERAKLARLGGFRGSPRRPVFVFAHFLTTHDPYVFARDGAFLSAEAAKAIPHDRLYVDQVIFTNRELLKVVDALQSRREVNPIIVIQSDEGPVPFRGEDSRNIDWTLLAAEQHDHKFGILTAVYFPESQDAFWDSISPVNVMRIVFSRTFRAPLPPLPDLQFVYRDERHPYEIFRRAGDRFIHEP